MNNEKYYVLTKLSEPVFEFGTHDICFIYDQLEYHCCSYCRDYIEEYDEETDSFIEKSSNYSLLPLDERFAFLLGSSCGAEFLFEEYDSYVNYVYELEQEYLNG